MNLQWPGFLVLLVLLPALAGLYIWAQRRRRRFALRYSSLALLRDALPRQSKYRRHVPFALFLAALASLVFALVRPETITLVPAGQATILLTIDVSRSMEQNDIFPNRLRAAQDAALSFIESRTSNTQIGIVVFAGYAQLVQEPTTDQEALEDTINSLTTGRGTAIGSGIIEAIDAIAEVNRGVAPVEGIPVTGIEPTPVPEGYFVPDIIVMLTDGVPTTGPLPSFAAGLAAERGIRVYTIGFGTERGGVMPFEGGQMFGGGGFGGGGGGRFRRGIDEAMLREIADLTGAEYYSASTASELQEVFSSLPTYLITREERTEITVVFAGLGAGLAALALLLALRWHPLP